jgi:hypothetical protein
MESAANRLQKEAKGYLDSLRGSYPIPSVPIEEVCVVGLHIYPMINSYDGFSNAHC